ncbi:protein translocase subunit SecD [Streptomyces purpureus]|uniref:Multifunctional fusion protein n=1 Tax=Streptomyces purpureus TaxID=1951 RepID=A0A918H1Z9_9ACTN|nr:protein translocase subunit SecD [Streptomyces purpureus]GGT29744.1 protein translocase subunit SecDF [Streptomyces purpureus]
MSSRATAWRALFALAVVAVSLFFAFHAPARLGLDLRGGTRIVLETQDSPTVRADAAATDRALEVLRQRVDALGVAEPTLARSGERRIVVELPGVRDPREAAALIGRTAQLSFHPVLGQAAAPDGKNVLADPDTPGRALRLAPAALTGDGVNGADAVIDERTGGWRVDLSFRGKAGEQWARITGEAACAPQGDPKRRVAIVLDGRIVSAPGMQTGVPCGAGIPGGSGQITGGFDAAAAKELAALVEGGALPVPVTTVEQSTVGPTLGADAIRASAQAALIGLVCTAVFVMVVYRLLGALATVALALYGLIAYACVVALGATLTLPGLAGFVLAVGMAVDANVLVFERAREEYANGGGRSKGAGAVRDLRRPLRTGFAKAFSAVADSNVTTLLAAGLLFFFATGPVKGFGVTLAIGVVASMVSALVITRVLAEWAVRRRFVARRPGLTGMASTGRVRAWLARRRPRLMRRRRLWLGLCAGLVLCALAGIGVRGLELGVEFTGGRVVEYTTARTLDADTARAAVSEAGFPRAVVQTSDGDGVTVRTGDLSNDEQERIRAALAAAGNSASVERDELIGPSLGSELRTKALIALGVAVAAQLVYLSVRFRWTFAAAAVTAMVQDVLLVVGLFAWLGRPVDSVFLAALLTVIGYSVNDTVVVFDRLRELRRAAGRSPVWPELADRAVVQTMPRTVNTGMGALFVLLALAVLGGDSLTDFSIALLAGVVAGIASSVFTAMPLAVVLETRHPAPVRPARGAARKGTGAVV